MRPITPFLWFDTNAEEAVNFYCSIFKNSKINLVTHYSDAGPFPKGTVMTIDFELEGQTLTAMNGGPGHKFTDAISLVTWCDTQEEIDYKWERLAAGGQEIQCGWLTDKYGLSWQVTPPVLIDMMKDTDPVKAKRVAEAMFGMVKLDIEGLTDAYNQE
jgi:predicted 3-demethylubiquinone-9 3-methyltransferase (glyoxalase superfamily)